MRPSPLLLALACAPAAVGGTSIAGEPPAQPSPPDPLVIVDDGTLRVKARLEALAGGFAYTGTWYGLASLGPARYRADRSWAELWLEPGVTVSYRVGPGFELYGGLSAGFSQTVGSDAFAQRDKGALRMENAYAGIRTTNPAEGFNLDLSTGRQDYGIGTGMLIWQGGGNGFERGAGNLLPRTAWANTTVARASFGGFKVEGYLLDPDELSSNDTHTRLAGTVVDYSYGSGSRLGGTVLKVLQSDQVYPLPTLPLLIPKGRDGLTAMQVYGRLEGTDVGLPGGWIRAEYAREENDRISMQADAYYAEIGYAFNRLPLRPTLAYGFASFSGDDPRTRQYERFDPLYYGNGLDNWWFGANGAYAFLNSNVRHHRLSLNLTLGERDFFKAQYVTSFTDELNSPIQFGQAARPTIRAGGLTITTGVQKWPLASELYGEWTHLWSPAVATGVWASAAVPGRGLTSLPGIEARTWYGAGLLLSARF
jgi:hypothetical protein